MASSGHGPPVVCLVGNSPATTERNRKLSKQRRRRIRPHEQARVDQTLAAARDHGANDPRTAVLVVAYADPGVQCRRCDCNPLEQHGVPGYRCAGCPREALYMVHAMVGTPEQLNYPLCAPPSPRLPPLLARGAARPRRAPPL